MTLLYTALTLVAFAANSLLCRLALGAASIDAASFTSIRLASGAAILALLSSMLPAFGSGRNHADRAAGRTAPRWRSAIALFAYAIAFSFAYLSLTTGTGALILFGAVQTTMLSAALLSGERPRAAEWAGLASALLGLIVLVFPGLTSPPAVGSTLMAIAGVSWGLYSLWGRGTPDPLADTTKNFIRVVPLTAAVSALSMVIAGYHVSPRGWILAAVSGAVTSGVGYVFWYAALRGLTAMRAAIVQLAVPVLAAVGGVVFLSESISLRLVTSAAMILGGIAASVMSRQ